MEFDSSEEKTVPARGQALIGTDISIAIPEGTYGRVAPRSGLGQLLSSLPAENYRSLAAPYSLAGVKHSITTGAGVIDADYRGKVGVLLFNLGDKDFESAFARIFSLDPPMCADEF